MSEPEQGKDLGEPTVHRAPRLSWTNPICERCWIVFHSIRTDEGVAIDRPFFVHLEEGAPPEICCHCGGITIVGIFTRIDPTTVQYPAYKEG